MQSEDGPVHFCGDSMKVDQKIDSEREFPYKLNMRAMSVSFSIRNSLFRLPVIKFYTHM